MTKTEKKIKFVKEILPKLPEYIEGEDGQRYKLMISEGEAWFKNRSVILKRFKKNSNHDVGIAVLKWLEKNRKRFQY